LAEKPLRVVSLGNRQLAAPAVESALSEFPHVTHIQVEDGLGRFFRVKLWPTLIAIQDGVELARVVRPTTIDDLRPALALLAKLLDSCLVAFFSTPPSVPKRRDSVAKNNG
jgi:hypothetical protein